MDSHLNIFNPKILYNPGNNEKCSVISQFVFIAQFAQNARTPHNG
jgi:hypothetical protein